MQVPTRGQDARLALATPDGANMRIITMESTCELWSAAASHIRSERQSSRCSFIH